MDSYKDSRIRSIIKALSWRVFATSATILVVFAFTRRLVLSLGVGAIEVVMKPILYYLHEKDLVGCACREEKTLAFIIKGAWLVKRR